MRSVDIPQADRLDRIREVVAAIDAGANTASLVRQATGLSKRHAAYHLHAARILGWINEAGAIANTTSPGRKLLRTARDSSAERRAFAKAVANSPIVRDLAPELLDPAPPSLKVLTSRIVARAGLSEATAGRRALTLLYWRDRVRQAALPHEPVVEQEVIPPAPTAAESTVRLRRIQIENFGPIRRVDASIGEFAVLVGPNATGKSTFMDALSFAKDLLVMDVTEVLRLRGTTLEELLWFGQGVSFRLAFEFSLPTALQPSRVLSVARYELEIGRLNDGAAGVVHEAFYLRPDGGPGNGLCHRDTPKGWQKVLGLKEAGVAWYGSERTSWKTVFRLGNHRAAMRELQEIENRFPAALRVRRLLREGVHKLALNPTAMEQPCSPLEPRTFLPDGANIALVVRHLQRVQPDRGEEWLEHLREALPEIRRVRVVEREEDKHVYLKVTYRGGHELPIWRLSDGTRRILALTLLSFATDRERLNLIEEPENGVHPAAIEAVYQAVSSPYDAQVLVATHSPVFLGIVPREKLLCFSREAGATRIRPGSDHPALREWKRDADLAVLFASGVL